MKGKPEEYGWPGTSKKTRAPEPSKKRKPNPRFKNHVNNGELGFPEGCCPPENYSEKASRLCELGRDGNTDAMVDLAVMHDTGDGVPMDKAEAASLCRRAADLGLALAMRNLAVMLAKGNGVPMDKAEAARLFKMSVGGGNGDSASVLMEAPKKLAL
jgi:TPR repeat protein